MDAAPSSSRMENWFRLTSTPFDPIDSAGVLQDRELQCPKCRKIVVARKCRSLSPVTSYSDMCMLQPSITPMALATLSSYSLPHADVGSKLPRTNSAHSSLSVT